MGRAGDGSLEVEDESSFPSAVHVAAVGIYPVHVRHDDPVEDDLLLGDHDGNLEAVEENILPLVVFYHVLAVAGGILQVGVDVPPLKDHGGSLEVEGDPLLEARDGNLEAVGALPEAVDAYARLSAAVVLRGLVARCYGDDLPRVYAEAGNRQMAAVDSGVHIRSHCHRTLRSLPRTQKSPSPFQKLAQ